MDYLFLTGIFAAIATLWNQIKNILIQLRSIFIVTMLIQYDGAKSVGLYLSENAKMYGLGLKQYTTHSFIIKSVGEFRTIPFELVGKNGTIFILDKKPLFVTRGTDNQQGTDKSDTVTQDLISLKISFIRGHFNADEIMKKSAEFMDKKNRSNGNNNRRFVRRVFGISQKRAMMSKDSNSGESPAIASSKGWDISATYGTRIIGYNFEDIGSVMPYFGIKDMVLSDDAENAIQEIRHWYKRKNLTGDLTFDCLLNCIDGVERSDGVFLIITTNYLEKIDSALAQIDNGKATRPSRIDRVIEMTNPDKNGLYKIANRILKEYPDMINNVVIDGYNDTGAQFQERCVKFALDRFWKEKQ